MAASGAVIVRFTLVLARPALIATVTMITAPSVLSNERLTRSVDGDWFGVVVDQNGLQARPPVAVW